MQHDVLGNGIAYGLYTLLGINRFAYRADLAQQIMSGQFHNTGFPFVDATAQISIPNPFVCVHTLVTITAAHKQVHVGIESHVKRQLCIQVNCVEKIHLAERFESFLCRSEAFPVCGGLESGVSFETAVVYAYVWRNMQILYDALLEIIGRTRIGEIYTAVQFYIRIHVEEPTLFLT